MTVLNSRKMAETKHKVERRQNMMNADTIKSDMTKRSALGFGSSQTP